MCGQYIAGVSANNCFVRRPARRFERQELAHCRSSGVLHSRSGHRRITDVPARMSVHRRIPDAAPSGVEGRSLTQPVWKHRFFQFLEHIGLELEDSDLLSH